MSGDSGPPESGSWQRELEAHCMEHGLSEPIYLPVTQKVDRLGRVQGCHVRVGDDIFSSKEWHGLSNVDDAREDAAKDAIVYYRTTIERKYTNILRECLKAGDHRGAEQSIHAGANVNGLVYPAEGQSPLLIAIGRRDITAIHILVSAGADINYGGTLRVAVCTGDANTVFALLTSGADVHSDGVLVVAVEYGNPEVLRMLVHAGADVDALQRSGGSALIIAVLHGHTDFIRALINSGADVNKQCPNCQYQTALVAAIRAPSGTHDGNRLTNERRIQIIRILVERGADVNLQLTNSYPGNPLDAALNTEDERIIRTILVAGVDVVNAFAVGSITCQWELPRIFADEGNKLDIYSVPTMTQKLGSVLLSACADYLEMAYGKRSIEILEGIVCALKDPDGVCVKDHMVLRATSQELSVIVNWFMKDLLDAVIWLCLAFREPPPGGPQVSTGALDGKKLRLSSWQPLNELTTVCDNTCWSALFDSAVIVLEPSTRPVWGWTLELTFENMVQLAAVEYPVLVDNGIVLMGYSTALIPVGKNVDQSIVWHLEVALHDSQLNISELRVTRGSWLKTHDFAELRSHRNLLGWCGNANLVLGTMHATVDIKRSDASTKHTLWQWTGANLQLVGQSGGPAQVGGQLGLSFCRKMMAVHFSPSDNYLKCLRNSIAEQIIVYDAAQRRAWLISLVCALHQMLLSYAKAHGLTSGVPQTASGNNGGLASFKALKDDALSVIDRSSNLELTIRDLILGFSVNLSKTSLQKASRRKIYGYEFWDIIEDATHCELKQRQLQRLGLAWAPLLAEIKCLFCSNFGDAIIGQRAVSVHSPCNRVPAGQDLMTASNPSINAILERHGAGLCVANGSRILSGTPFQQCSHRGQKDTCWESPSFLQDIRGPRPGAGNAFIKPGSYPNGAVVFGRRGNRFAYLFQK